MFEVVVSDASKSPVSVLEVIELEISELLVGGITVPLSVVCVSVVVIELLFSGPIVPVLEDSDSVESESVKLVFVVKEPELVESSALVLKFWGSKLWLVEAEVVESVLRDSGSIVPVSDDELEELCVSPVVVEEKVEVTEFDDVELSESSEVDRESG